MPDILRRSPGSVCRRLCAVRPEAAPSGEEQQSVLFRQTPAPAEAAPRPAEPENIRKPTPYTGSIRILAQVNGDIITTEDINHRVRAFCMTTGIPYNRQTKLLIINKVMQNTIDEKLKAQEAARSQIETAKRKLTTPSASSARTTASAAAGSAKC